MPLKICYDNQADEAIVSEENSTLKLPPSNVQDQRLSRIYQGGESINFNIYGDGAPKTISQAYTNEVQDPNDLRSAGANWTASNTTDELSTLSINGNLFTKILNSGANSGYNYQLFGDSWTNLILTGHVILKKGSSAGNTALFMVRAVTGTIATIFVISPDWDNYGSSPATPSNGILLDYNWIDSETLELFFQCDALGALTDDVQVRCFGSPNATNGEYTYFSEVQLIDDSEIIMFPFVDGTHAIDIINETFTMPDKFIIRITNIEPRSRFDMATQKTVLSWRIDGNNRLVIAYDPATDKYFVLWKNGTNAAVMLSQQFDSGSSFTDINQKLDMYIFLNLASGGQTDSMFIVNPKESGAIFQDDSWSLTPDVKSSTFPTLSNGHENSISQLDGVEEKIEIIEWDGVKPTITTTALMDAYVEGKKVILDLTYMNRLTATDLLIANSTINAGDTITLRGNDWDSFNSGTPVDESVSWSKDIIKHTFTKASHQYWRVIVNSSNDISMGRLSLGPCYTTPGIAYLIPQDVNSATKKTYGVAGQSYGDRRYFFDQVSARWPDLTEEEKDDLIEIFKTVDISKPFFITYDKAGATLGTMYVTFDMKSLKVTPLGKRNLYTVTAKFREEVK